MSYLVIQSKVLNEKIILVTKDSFKTSELIRIQHPKLVKYYPKEINLLWDNSISRISLKEIHRIKKNMKGNIISAENLSRWNKKPRDERDIF